jgi:hypothetical protein
MATSVDHRAGRVPANSSSLKSERIALQHLKRRLVDSECVTWHLLLRASASTLLSVYRNAFGSQRRECYQASKLVFERPRRDCTLGIFVIA